MEKKYRVGLIGVGSIAHIAHLPILAARTDVEMVGAFAEHIESVQRTQKSYAIQNAVHNMDELLNLGLDCAFVLSPKTVHAEQVVRLLEAGVDLMHFDVMDGHFVPNISYGAPVLKCLHAAMPDVYYDVHLMISDPARYAADFARAGASLITFHLEAVPDTAEEVIAAIRAAGSEGDSVGGILETIVTGLPAGIGEPWFDSVESELAHLMFAIPACKGIAFGAGFGFAAMHGSEANDPFTMRDGKIATATNKNGGINGGITNGMPIVFRTVLKPTPSIYKQQHTVDYIGRTDAELQIKGRHDPCIVPRAAVVQNSLTAFGLLDLLTVRYGTLAQKHGFPKV